MASLGVGSVVWVEDPDDAWIDGEVVGVNGEKIEVLCTSGKRVRILTNHMQGLNMCYYFTILFFSMFSR